MKVLVVEDEARIAAVVSNALKSAGLAVDVIADGEQAWFAGDTESYDAVVLDLGLPKIDGLTVLKKWRAAGRRFPVLILTARGVWTDRVAGINAGADDYLAKPFEVEELVARVRALLRRSSGQATPVLQSGAFALDTVRMQVSVDGQPVALSPLEYRLFAYLMHHAGRVVPSTELTEHLYETGNDKDPNAIEVIVARLRRKLGSGAVETRRGFGYIVADGR